MNPEVARAWVSIDIAAHSVLPWETGAPVSSHIYAEGIDV